MPLHITCPSCGHAADVPDEHAGLPVFCPRCHAEYAIPGPAADRAHSVAICPECASAYRVPTAELAYSLVCMTCYTRFKPAGPRPEPAPADLLQQPCPSCRAPRLLSRSLIGRVVGCGSCKALFVVRPPGVEVPAPTTWPLVLALGLSMLGAGVATSLAFTAVGAALFLVGLAGWIAQLLPGRGHVLEPLARRPAPIRPAPGTVATIAADQPGYRFYLPQKVHPISAGVKGGAVGGLVMPIPALIYGLVSGHGLWWPVNLLAAMVLSTPDTATRQQLEAFSLSALVVGVVIHATMSLSFGLIYGVVLPMLPSLRGLGPLFWGGVLMPLLWTSLCYALMGVTNPVLAEHVDWAWFLLSQLVYGLAMSFVVYSTEKVHAAPPPRLPSAAVALLLALLTAGCDLPGKPQPGDRFQRPEAVLSFHDLYATHCAGCHGAGGQFGAGPPLNDELFRALVPTAEVEAVIRHGRHGTLMPAFAKAHGGALTEVQVQVLVHEIKGIAYRIDAAKVIADPNGTKPAWGVPAPAPQAPPYLAGKEPGDWRAGLAVFRTACAGCHGPDGKGEKRLNDPAFLALNSDQVLRRYIITGRPDLKMPSYREPADRGANFQPLTARQVADLTALLARWRMSNK